MQHKYLTIILVLLIGLGFSCRKKDIISNDPSLKLEFSNDSIIFDTVFTSLGSTTHRLMIYNTSSSKLNISNISLENGESSEFRINLDGEAGSSFSDIEIEGNDSLFVFARVTINPQDKSTPYVVEDKIHFVTNGNEQEVKLVAWGQDANYILADTYVDGFPPFKVVADSLETIHWTADKPYVIYGYAVIDSYGKLIIDEGCQIHFHDGGGLWAYADGVLKVNGSLENKVIFSGDRLEDDYNDVPGQWDRIWLMEAMPGENHEISNAIIKNGFIGIQSESFLRAAENKLFLHNVIIQNMTGFGLFSRLYNIESSNTLIANCGAYCTALTAGGNYNFTHATFGNFWNFSVRNTPALILNNYLLDSLENPVPFSLNFNMGNSIVYGYNIDEFETDFVGGADSLYFFDHCLMKTSLTTTDGDNFRNIIKNEDPLFLDPSAFDFRIDTLSPAIGIGDPSIASQVSRDLNDKPRLPLPDLGVYQFVPGQSVEMR